MASGASVVKGVIGNIGALIPRIALNDFIAPEGKEKMTDWLDRLGQIMIKEVPMYNAKRWTEPARRHRCETCGVIFECHLCSIDDWHAVHTAAGADASTTVLVCEECCRYPSRRYQYRTRGLPYYRDMLTGEELTAMEALRRIQQ
jgi:hypothetical protein